MSTRSKYGGKTVLLILAGGILLSGMASSAYADLSKTLEFIPAQVDFGVIREENGKVSKSVKAVNVSPDTTFIISARTSCGCSAAEYPDAHIAPGDTVEVTVSYDPTNRPGKFLKTARFFTGEERIGNSLKLNGMVIPSSRNLDKAYPDKAGVLRLSAKMLTPGEISRTEARPMFVGIYNDSDRPIALSASADGAALEAAIAPDTIEPFGIATLSLMIKGRNIPEGAKEIMYKAGIIDAANGETIAEISVAAPVK